MTIKTEKYVRKPLYVDAVQVTRDNFFEIAHWCNGEIANTDPGHRDVNHLNDSSYVRIMVHSPQSERQKQAHVGDWILKSPKGYKIYTDRSFRNTFDLDPPVALKKAWAEFKSTIAGISEEIQMPSEEKGPKRHFRGAKHGPKVTSDAICDTCGSPKGTHALGELCNNNCGGTVIPNPAKESQV